MPSRREFIKYIVTSASLALATGILGGIGGYLYGYSVGSKKPPVTKTITVIKTVPPKKTEFEKFSEQYPELAEGFNEVNYKSALKYLHAFPELREDVDLHEFTNHHIKQWDLILYEKLKLSPSDESLHRLKLKDFGYMLNLAEEGKSVLPIRKHKMLKDYPSKEDREWINRARACPSRMAYVDSTTGNRTPGYSIETIRKNVDSLPKWRDQITSLYESVEIDESRMFEEPWPISFKEYKNLIKVLKGNPSKEYLRSRWGYCQWLPDRSYDGWEHTAKMFRKYDKILKQQLDLIRFMYGYSRGFDINGNSRKYHEATAISMTPIVAKSLGYAMTTAYATPWNTVSIADVVFLGVKKSLLDIFDKNPEIYGTRIRYKGAGVGFMVAKEPLIQDGVRVVHEHLPTGEEIYHHLQP